MARLGVAGPAQAASSDPQLAKTSQSAAAPQVVPGSEAQATVVLTARIINGDQVALRSPRIRLHAPVALPHQDIGELDVEGDPERIADGWGSPVLVYERDELAPRAILTGRWTAWAAIRRFKWDLHQDVRATDAALSAEEQALCLRDGRELALSSPVIGAAAEEAARGKTGAAGVLDGAFGLVMDRLTYERDGKWLPAPEVLSSGKGSCSEYTYCFIALCRKNGIPARYVGGIVGRLGVPYYLDRVFHRFPQAHVPGFGWVDFDPTRTERAENKRLYFGQTPGPMLLTSVGDGGEGSLTGADYLESHSWADRDARRRVSSLRQAWWFAPPSPAVRARVEQFRRRLVSVEGAQRAALVADALEVGDPFVLPWLDDLLYEPVTRVAAAGACLDIGGEGALAAVANSLERLNDAEGDRQIGQRLDRFTGEQIGGNRAKWNEWLKTRTPRTPLPGDQAFNFDEAARSVPKPRELWPIVRKHCVPLDLKILSDEVVTSDTDPGKRLRKVTAHFWSQELAGKKWGHPCTLLLPADTALDQTPDRKGKAVLIGCPGREAYPIHVAKYGEPIAARTGYPTLVLCNPGTYPDGSDIEPDIDVLGRLARETGQNYYNMNCQLAVVYIQAMNALEELLNVDTVRVVVGGHSKRGRSATVAAAMDSRVASAIVMGNEGVYRTDTIQPHLSFHHGFFQDQVEVPVFYLGATNEDGYRMFNVNVLQERLRRPMTIELIPNYNHSNYSEIQFMDFLMWVAHVFDGRPITRISDVAHRRQRNGTVFRARLSGEAKVQVVKAWYAFTDDPAWRDVMWYHVLMRPSGDFHEGFLPGSMPDAFLVEVGDIALGIPGYVSSVPHKLTDAPVIERVSRGPYPKLWSPETQP